MGGGDFAELGTPTLNLMHEVRKPKMGLRHPSVDDDDQTVNEKGHKCFLPAAYESRPEVYFNAPLCIYYSS